MRIWMSGGLSLQEGGIQEMGMETVVSLKRIERWCIIKGDTQVREIP